MENINLGCRSKLTFIKWLIATLLACSGWSAFAAFDIHDLGEWHIPYYMESENSRTLIHSEYVSGRGMYFNYTNWEWGRDMKISIPNYPSGSVSINDNYLLQQFAGQWSNSVGRDIVTTQKKINESLEWSHHYTLVVFNKTKLDIALSSTRSTGYCDVDTFIYLFDEDGNHIDDNDDFTGSFERSDLNTKNCSLDSGLVLDLSPGRYILVAGTYYSNKSGYYTLSVGSPSAENFILKPKNAIYGRWERSGGRVRDRDGNIHYHLEMKENGIVDIDLVSNTDTYLFLSDDQGNMLASNDDRGDGSLNSRLFRKDLNKGFYTVTAGTYHERKNDFFMLSLTGKNAKLLPKPISKLVPYGPPKPSIKFTRNQVATDYVNINNHNSATVDYRRSKSYNTSVQNADNRIVFYQSDNPSVAIINDHGLITTVGIGETNITLESPTDWLAANEFQSDTFRLKVEKGEAKLDAGADKSFSYEPNKHYQQEASGLGEKIYSSSNELVATVDNSGNVTIKGAGECDIKVESAPDSLYRGEGVYQLEVKKGKQQIYLDKTTIKYRPTIEAKSLFSYKTGLIGDLSIQSHDEKIASYNESDGTLNINGIGEVKLTVTFKGNHNYHDKTKNYELLITKAQGPYVDFRLYFTGPKYLSVNRQPYTERQYQDVFKEYTTEPFKIDLIQNDGPKIVYHSSNTDVATVDGQGNITTKAIGESVISAYREANEFYEQSIPSVFKLVVTKAKQKVEFKNKTKQIRYADTFTPQLKHNQGWGKLEFTSSNPQIATVDEKGLVTATGVGKVKITATRLGDHSYFEAKDSLDIDVNNAVLGNTSINFRVIGDDQDGRYESSAYVTKYAPNKIIKTDFMRIFGATYKYSIKSDVQGILIDLGNGEFKVEKAGSATISLTIKVKNFEPAKKSIQLNIEHVDYPFDFGDSEVLISAKGGFDKYVSLGAPPFSLQNHSTLSNYKTYSSSSSEVAEIDAQGMITVKSVGQTKITMNILENDRYKTETKEFTLHVTEPKFKFSRLVIDKQMFANEFTQKIHEDYKGDDVIYSSANKSVASVDSSSGKVTIHSPGQATISAKTDLHSAHYKLRVAKAEQKIYFQQMDSNGFTFGDKRFVLNAVSADLSSVWRKNHGVAETPITYSYNSDVAVRDEKTGKVTIKKPGVWKVVATKAGDNNYKEATAEFIQSVTDDDVYKLWDFLTPSGVKINRLEKKCGATFTLRLTQHGGMNELWWRHPSSFSYETNNPAVATVNNHGEVTVVGLGEAVITGHASDHGRPMSTSYTLTVNGKGNQAIQFKGEKNVLIYDDRQSYTKGIIDGWGERSIRFSSDNNTFSVEPTSGVVTLSQLISEDFQKATITATKDEDSCYHAATDSYTITKYKNAIHSPDEGEIADQTYLIKWSFSGSSSGSGQTSNRGDLGDSEGPNTPNVEKISLFYSNTYHDGKANIEESTQIARVDLSDNTYQWDTSALPEGDYYIFATVGNETFYTERPLVVEHNHGVVMDCSKMYNYPAKLGSAPSNCSSDSMALIRNDGTILSWGNAKYGAVAPSYYDFSKIYSSGKAYAGLSKDGSIVSWGEGNSSFNSPSGNDFTDIYATSFFFAAHRSDGSIAIWDSKQVYNAHALSSRKFTKVVSSDMYFAALDDNGIIWAKRYGNPTNEEFDAYEQGRGIFEWETIGIPSRKYIDLVGNPYSFAAITENGSIHRWYDNSVNRIMQGSSIVPNDSDFIKIFPGLGTIHGEMRGYSALRADGSMVTWGPKTFRSIFDTYGGELSVSLKRYLYLLYEANELEKFPDKAVDAIEMDYATRGPFYYGKKYDGYIEFFEASPEVPDYPLFEVDSLSMEGDRILLPKNDDAIRIHFKCKLHAPTYPSELWWLTPECDLSSLDVKASKKLQPSKKYYVFARVIVALTPDYRFVIYTKQETGHTAILDERGLLRSYEEDSMSRTLDYREAQIYNNAKSFVANLPGSQLHNYREAQIYNKAKSFDANFPGSQLHRLLLGTAGSKLHEYTPEEKHLSHGKIYTTKETYSILSARGKVYFMNGGSSCASEKSSLPSSSGGCVNPPDEDGFVKIFTNKYAFAGLRNDGSIFAWGGSLNDESDKCGGHVGAPLDSGYISIYSTECSFTAIKADGTIFTWGHLKDFEKSFPKNIENRSIISF